MQSSHNSLPSPRSTKMSRFFSSNYEYDVASSSSEEDLLSSSEEDLLSSSSSESELDQESDDSFFNESESESEADVDSMILMQSLMVLTGSRNLSSENKVEVQINF